MSDLLIGGETNDLVVTMGDLSLCTGSSAIAQDVLQQLQVFLGEWFLNTSLGLPWLQQILVKQPNIDVIDGLIQNAILAVDGIDQLITYNYTFDSPSRTLSITFQATTYNGQTVNLSTTVGV